MKHKLLFITTILLTLYSTFAVAQDLEYDFYMSAALDNYFNHNISNGNSSNNLDIHMDDWSTFGMILSYGNLSGVFELAPREDFINALYARYDYSDSAGFGLGLSDTIAAYNYQFNQISGDGSLVNFGTLDDSTLPMLFWDGYGASIAIIYPYGGDGVIIPNDSANEYFDFYGLTNSIELPRFEVAYNFVNDYIDANVFLGYGAYLYDYSLATGTEDTLTAHTFTVGLGGNATVDNFRVDYTAWYAINPYLSGVYWHEDGTAPAVTTNTDGKYELENSTAFGGALAFSYIIGRFTPQIGFGYTNADNSQFQRAAYASYLNVSIQLYDWLILTPEISYDNAVITNIATNTDDTTANIYAGFSIGIELE